MVFAKEKNIEGKQIYGNWDTKKINLERKERSLPTGFNDIFDNNSNVRPISVEEAVEEINQLRNKVKQNRSIWNT